jgi:hypothetical protein
LIIKQSELHNGVRDVLPKVTKAMAPFHQQVDGAFFRHYAKGGVEGFNW